MSKNAKLGFEMKPLRLPLSEILPVRHVAHPDKIVRYQAILKSIKEVGMIEPLIVYKKEAIYLLLDGHLRHAALLELGETDADCLLSTDDECYTYNARVTRLSPIQEHAMITKAVKAGVTPARIAASLNMEVSRVFAILNILDGIHEDAVELLKAKPIAHGTIVMLRRVSGIRQIEMAELMVRTNNFSAGYAKALIMGTPKDQVLRPEKPKAKEKLTPEDRAKLEQEVATLERDFRAAENDYGKNMLNLTFLKGYIQKLLVNPNVARFLSSRRPEMFAEFESVARMESV